jgi:hypothetical protein
MHTNICRLQVILSHLRTSKKIQLHQYEIEDFFHFDNWVKNEEI